MEVCHKFNESSDKIPIDEACLNVNNYDDLYTLDVWAQSEECFSCCPWKYASLKPREDTFLRVNSTYSTSLYVRFPHKSIILHSYTFHFVQQGIYLLQFNSSHFLPIVAHHQGDNEYKAIFAAFFFFFFLYLFWLGTKFLQTRMEEDRHYIATNADEASTSGILNEERSSTENDEVERSLPDPTSATRLRSLDTFRGLTIVIMIFVNYGGGKYYFFKHSPWNGLTVADLVFPWFLWVMGVSLTFSIKSQLRRMTPYYVIVLRILKRSLTLLFLGIIINSLHSNYLPEFRVPGVLQRLAFCYLINALLEALCMKPQESTEYFRGWWLRDVLWAWVQWLIIGLLILLHTTIILAFPVPGCPKGYLGPGGVHAQGKYPNCTGGASGYIDQIILGRNHLYRHPTCKIIYDSSIPFDPEGILGVLTSCLTVQLGVAAGRIILYYPNHYQRMKRWILWGLYLGIVGGLLCDWSKERGFLPVNKNLWSLSYVCVTSSFAFLLLLALYFWIDVKKRWKGTIFRIAGMNAILLYVGHEVTKELFPWSWSPVPPYHANHLIRSLWGTCLWLIIAFVCHKKKFYLTV